MNRWLIQVDNWLALYPWWAQPLVVTMVSLLAWLLLGGWIVLHP
ncbi:hypothetical protein [Solirubrum puertoriconensis]|nr:hypothetical protein [Solirubrum puertoriconensis]